MFSKNIKSEKKTTYDYNIVRFAYCSGNKTRLQHDHINLYPQKKSYKKEFTPLRGKKQSTIVNLPTSTRAPGGTGRLLSWDEAITMKPAKTTAT